MEIQFEYFVGMVAFLANFHEATDGLYVLTHSGAAGCNICSYRKKPLRTRTYHITLTRVSFLCAINLQSVLSGNTPLFENKVYRTRYLGMFPDERVANKPPALVILHERLRPSASHNPIRSPFDAFASNWVASDHCWVGNIRNLLHVLFLSLRNDDGKTVLNNIIHNEVSNNTDVFERRAFNTERYEILRVPSLIRLQYSRLHLSQLFNSNGWLNPTTIPDLFEGTARTGNTDVPISCWTIR